ncbi:hypothetical protein [Sphingomonas sp.]|uniref:hypothetical protein n=1 Tax=Sphingomonas sp. TaxID=28214 RepID=UPI002FDA6CC1
MKMPLVPLAAVFLGGVSALTAFVLPATALEAMVSAKDGAGWGTQAAPLMAGASRLVLAIATGAIAAGAGAFLAHRLLRSARATGAAASLDSLPTPRVRRADSHPDARPRAPLRATHELDIPAWAAAAAPEAEVPAPAERELPVDLEQPLAAFDPLAIPAVPLPPPVPPRRERAASAALRNAAARDPADRLVRPETDATVHALLERLERGVVRRSQVAQTRRRVRTDRGLDDALAALRSLARQA